MNPRIEEIIPQTRDEWIGEIKKTLRRWDGIKKYHPQKWEELNIHKIVIDDIAFLLAEVERLEREKFVLSSIIKDTFWMARRYANGRQTYAPGMVRDAYRALRAIDVDIGTQDPALETGMPPDYLNDCNE